MTGPLVDSSSGRDDVASIRFQSVMWDNMRPLPATSRSHTAQPLPPRSISYTSGQLSIARSSPSTNDPMQ